MSSLMYIEAPSDNYSRPPLHPLWLKLFKAPYLVNLYIILAPNPRFLSAQLKWKTRLALYTLYIKNRTGEKLAAHLCWNLVHAPGCMFTCPSIWTPVSVRRKTRKKTARTRPPSSILKNDIKGYILLSQALSDLPSDKLIVNAEVGI